ncbi:Peptidase S8 pro-domain [Popillia japonica]|uniref:Peptidase S8 pro-domain n=1 Tax=Popillia japonica TaxID=7064 RepID=A0AAW1JFU7_POPJA
MVFLKLSFGLIVSVCCAIGFAEGSRTPPLFNNEFAVHIPEGHAAANDVADRHGFVNRGQVGSLKGYYLFEHKHVHKRSTEANDFYHRSLLKEPQVSNNAVPM